MRPHPAVDARTSDTQKNTTNIFLSESIIGSVDLYRTCSTKPTGGLAAIEFSIMLYIAEEDAPTVTLAVGTDFIVWLFYEFSKGACISFCCSPVLSGHGGE